MTLPLDARQWWDAIKPEEAFATSGQTVEQARRVRLDAVAIALELDGLPAIPLAELELELERRLAAAGNP